MAILLSKKLHLDSLETPAQSSPAAKDGDGPGCSAGGRSTRADLEGQTREPTTLVLNTAHLAQERRLPQRARTLLPASTEFGSSASVD
jgi:hypothetical protein